MLLFNTNILTASAKSANIAICEIMGGVMEPYIHLLAREYSTLLVLKHLLIIHITTKDNWFYFQPFQPISPHVGIRDIKNYSLDFDKTWNVIGYTYQENIIHIYTLYSHTYICVCACVCVCECVYSFLFLISCKQLYRLFSLILENAK